MIAQLFNRVGNAVFPSEGRLQANFPWSWMKAGGTYLIANLWFALGSFVVPVVVMLALMAVSMASPQAADVIMPVISNRDGVPSTTFLTWMMLLSFVSGFGLEVLYIRKACRRAGTSLSEVTALSLNSLKGSNPLVTAWRVTWRVALTYGLWLLVAMAISPLLPAGHQDTVDFAKTLSGGNLLLFGVMAAVFAPVFEELVFRGFLFQGLRANFRQGRAGKLLGSGRAADFAAMIVSSAVFALMHMQWNPTTILMLFLLGCFHAELYRRSGSLYCSMMLHAVNNGLQVLLLVYGLQ